ncbi:outer membrane receptor protein involved in Fe transport [Caulobacter sp. BE264]|uniref:TonB-dependent receptor domain-containing protein n=1 Tax=Caulobacter sp. BE264 TaxID=2817724 RepID=UPI00285B312F|nr:TonB-dependent receptor [Caulobacter sp. BE264]MDR7232092.1 outer membrane receptor protein involved in Fe transport [Caulobacter sp. BE264]
MKIALLAGAAASAVMGGYAFAQDTTPAQSTVSEIVVTGSRIKRPQFDGTVPGVQVTKEEIIQRGFNNAYDVVLSQPQVSSGASPYGSNGGQTSSLGVAFADLLGFGPQRTLTLVNGRRVVSSNAATLFVSGNFAGSQVDVGMIPAQMIDRVDTLTVGGAAAYGSDAIAGVINYIIKDKYEGAEARVAYRTSDKGDGSRYSVNAIYGSNLLNDRANLAVSFEYTKTDSLYADKRPWIIDTATAVTNAFSGSKRNTAFSPTAAIDVAGLNNGAFLRTSDDGIPSTAYAYNARTGLQWPSGIAFTPSSQTGLCPQNIVGVASCVNGGGSLAFVSTASQLVPGIPTGNGLYSLTAPSGTFPNFAPTSLPTGVTAAAVFAKYGVTAPTGLTTAQLNTLAVNVLQSKLPTLREYLAQNPNTDVNLIVGSLYSNIPRIANTDPATSALFPFIARPVRFNEAGQAENWSFANISPTAQGTVNAAPGTKGFDNSRYNLIQNAQKRRVGTLFGTFDVNEHLTLYTQNMFSSISTRLPRNSVTANNVGSTAIETSGLVMSIDNPFLSAASRQLLRDSGAVSTAGKFIMSRTNQDILGDNPLWGKTDTSNLVQGAKGDFDLLGRNWTWDASYTWGRSSGRVDFTSIKDVEYALALDSVVDTNGAIVCRAKTNPAAYLGKSPAGISVNLTDVYASNGTITKTPFTPVVTQSMIDSCQPLNPFGYGQMSAAAKAYVSVDQFFAFENTQTFLQGSISGDLFSLPGGPVGIALAGERRTTSNSYWTDEASQFGRTRSAAIARTEYETTAEEYGIELNIPLLGEDFSLPFAQRLELNPAVRWSKQTGSAPTFVNALGKTINPEYDGDLARIWSLAGTFQPIKDIAFRGNVTRSIRQPDGVELFLGGQPAFTTPADPCTVANIGSGVNPTARKANCIAAVKKAGYATTDEEATNFLNSFTPPAQSLLGARFGNMGLQPERAESWTVGVVLEPRFVKNLRMSVDYVDISLKDQLSRVSLDQLSAYCYDSASYPDNTARFGTNTCDAFARYTVGTEPSTTSRFAMKDGWSSTYLNLAQTNLRAANIVISYRKDVASLFGSDSDWGRVSVSSNLYRILESSFSSTGAPADTEYYLGANGTPRWQTSTTVGYRLKKFSTSVNFNTVSDTVRFNGATPATIENNPYLERKGYTDFNLFFGYDITDDIQARINVNNVTDKRFIDERDATIYSSTGRTWQFSVNAKF